MRVLAITFGLVVSLVLACSAIYLTGCAPRRTRLQFSCVQTGAVTYQDDDGNEHVAVILACEQ